MSNKRKLTFPEDLRVAYFPDLGAEELPSRAALKEKILELHETGDEEGAAKLLPWNDKLKNYESSSPLSKASKIVMFTLAVAAATLGILWLIFGGLSGKSDTLVVCNVGGEILQGEQCFSDNPGGLKKETKTEDNKSDSGDILVGQE